MKKLLLLAIATFAAMSVRAQIGGLVNQVDDSQARNQLSQSAQEGVDGSNSVPQLYEGESSDVGPQTVVRAKPRRTLFEAKADVQLFYTDNLFLSETFKQDTMVLLSTAQFALAPTPYAVGNGTLMPSLGYRHQWFDFGMNGGAIPHVLAYRDLDFNAQTVFAGAVWQRDNWSFGGGLDATRLMQTSSYVQFYEELVPHWMARRALPINDCMAFAVSYEGDYRATHIRPRFLEFGTEDASDRTDHSIVLTYTQMLCKHGVFQPFYRMKYTHFTAYPEGPRNDYLNTLGAGLYWLVCPHFSVRTFVNYDILTTGNPRVEEYRKFDGGGGIDVTVRF